MHADTQQRPSFSKDWWKWHGARLGLNAAAFLLFFGITSMFATGARASLEWLVEHWGAGVAVGVGLVYMVLPLFLLPFVKREHFEGKYGVLNGGLVGFAAGCAGLLAFIFAGVSFAMAKLGWVTYVYTGPPDHFVANLVESYLWHLYDMVPAIHINRSLGNDSARIVLESVDTEGATDNKGVLLLAFRIMVGLVLFKAIVRIFTTAKTEACGEKKAG